MDYQEAMELLSQCSLGALLIAEDSMIIKANGMANSLLHGKGRLEGLYLCDIAPALCTESETRHMQTRPLGNMCCAARRRW